MKNNQGFTLVELLAVIVILAIVITIAVPSTVRVSNKIKENMFCSKINFIENAAKLYGEDRKEGKDWGSFYIYELVENGYLKKDVKNPDVSKGEGYIQDPRDKTKYLDNEQMLFQVINQRIKVFFTGNLKDDIDKICKKEANNGGEEVNKPNLSINSNSGFKKGTDYIYVEIASNDEILSKVDVQNGFAEINGNTLLIKNSNGEVSESLNIYSIDFDGSRPIAGGSRIEDFLNSISSFTGCELYVLRNESTLKTGTFEQGDTLGVYYNGDQIDQIPLTFKW